MFFYQWTKQEDEIGVDETGTHPLAFYIPHHGQYPS